MANKPATNANKATAKKPIKVIKKAAVKPAKPVKKVVSPVKKSVTLSASKKTLSVVAKPEPKKEIKKAVKVRIQTGEGWKRAMEKAHATKKKAEK